MNPEIEKGLAKAGVAGAQKHLFLCLGPDCCPTAEGEKVWEALKAGCRTLGVPVLRTKAACLRICAGGPWLVVYPEGIWYGGVTEERLNRILDEHVQNNFPITEWIVIQNCLGVSNSTESS
jgi:(2Fe-2S) ferredoxin